MNYNYTLTKKENIVFKVLQDELVLLNLESGYYYSTNDTGRIIWEMFDGTNTINDIISYLSSYFDIPIETAQNDVTEFINDISEAKLIRLD